MALLTKSLNEDTKIIQEKIDSYLNFKSVTNTAAKTSTFKKIFFQKNSSAELKIRKTSTQERAEKQLLDSLPQNPLTTSSPITLTTETISDTKPIDFLQSQLDLIALGEANFYARLDSFCEFLSGFAITKNGWVQSFGLEYYKPPILYDAVKPPDSPFLIEFANKKYPAKIFKVLLMLPNTILSQCFLRKENLLCPFLKNF